MKTFARIVLPVMLIFLGARAQAQGPNSGNMNNSGDALGGSLAITPTVNVNSLGGGNYQYTISFYNPSSTPIWDFLVWTDSKATSESSASFQNCNDLSVSGSVGKYYNAKNYNSAVSDCLAFYDGTTYPGTAVGGKTCSVTFECSGLYTSFICGYEVNGSWCESNGGKGCGGIGTCKVPEVSPTLILAGMAALGMVGFKKMVRS